MENAAQYKHLTSYICHQPSIVHTKDEMRAWLQTLGYSDAIKDATINAILREFVMSKVSCDEMSNMEMIAELLRPQLEVTKEYNK